MSKDKKGKIDFSEIFSNKKLTNAVAIVVALAFILIGMSFFTDGKQMNFFGINQSKEPSETSENQEENLVTEQQIKNYEEKQKNELVEILQQINGIGEVSVMLNFESGETKVPAVNKNTQVSVTEETDNAGGKRTNNQQTDGSTVVMAGENGSDPLILQVYKPRLMGAIIVAEGAENDKILYEIRKTVSSLYDLSLDKVNVYPMKK